MLFSLVLFTVLTVPVKSLPNNPPLSAVYQARNTLTMCQTSVISFWPVQLWLICTSTQTQNDLFSALLGIVKDGILTVGSVSAPVYNPGVKIKVPDVLFFNNPQVTPKTLHFTVNQIFPLAVIIKGKWSSEVTQFFFKQFIIVVESKLKEYQ